MNEYLPEIKYRDGIKRTRQTGFGGLDRRAAAGDGSIRFMRNMTTDHYPLMGARAKRDGVKLDTGNAVVTGFYCWNEKFIVTYDTDECSLSGCPHCEDGISHSHILLNGTPVNDSTGNPAALETTGEKKITHIGNYVCFWPDKVFLKFPEEGYENDVNVGKINSYHITGEEFGSDSYNERYDLLTGEGYSKYWTRVDLLWPDDTTEWGRDVAAAERDKIFKFNQGDVLELRDYQNNVIHTLTVASSFQNYNYYTHAAPDPNEYSIIGRISVQEDIKDLLNGSTSEYAVDSTEKHTQPFNLVRKAKEVTFGHMELEFKCGGVAYGNGKDKNGFSGTQNRMRALIYSDMADTDAVMNLDADADFHEDDCLIVSPMNLGDDFIDEYTTERSYIIRTVHKAFIKKSSTSGGYSDFVRYEFIFDDYSLPKTTNASRSTHSNPDSAKHGAPYFYISRKVPDLDGVFLHNNRLWGWKDDTIYCSGLGQPFNWFNYELSTGAWTVATGTPGKITAGCSYLGNPIFFKEDRLFKVYGEYPAQFRLSQVSVPGVREGGAKSLAICGRLLTYAGQDGIYQYAGSNSVNRISDTLGKHREPSGTLDQPVEGIDGHPKDYKDTFSFPFEYRMENMHDVFLRYSSAVAASDGRKYYINLWIQNGYCSRSSYKTPAFSLLCYDSYTGLWTVDEESCLMIDSVIAGDLYVLMRHNCKGSAMTVPANGVLWENHNQSDYRIVRMTYQHSTPSGFTDFFVDAEDKRDALLPDGSISEDAEGKISEAVFNDFSNGMAEKKGVSRIDFVALGNGSVTPFISWDGGAWQKLRDAVNVEGKKCYISTVVPRRTGVFRLKFIGTGEWMISNLEIEYYNGTDLQE